MADQEAYMHLGEDDLARPNSKDQTQANPINEEAWEKLAETANSDSQGLVALLSHLQRKIKNFEAERVSWLAKFEAARLSQSTRAGAVRSMRALTTDLMDLSRAVSECRVQTWEARLQRLELQRENKDLEHSQSTSQAQRVQELATVFDETEVKQVVDLKKSQKPHKITKFSMVEAPSKPSKANDFSLKQSKVGSNQKKPIGRFEAMTEPEKQVKAMYKTVVIPRDPGIRDNLDESLEHHVNLAVKDLHLDI